VGQPPLISSEHKDEIKKMGSYLQRLAQARDPSFYFEKQLGKDDAAQAKLQAEFIIRKILELIGAKNENNQTCSETQ
jgi:hypothetical protein